MTVRGKKQAVAQSNNQKAGRTLRSMWSLRRQDQEPGTMPSSHLAGGLPAPFPPASLSQQGEGVPCPSLPQPAAWTE